MAGGRRGGGARWGRGDGDGIWQWGSALAKGRRRGWCALGASAVCATARGGRRDARSARLMRRCGDDARPAMGQRARGGVHGDRILGRAAWCAPIRSALKAGEAESAFSTGWGVFFHARSSHAFRLFRGCPSRAIPAFGAVSRGKTIAGSCLGAPDACFGAPGCVRAVSSAPFRLRCCVVAPSEFDEMPGIFASTQASNRRE